jgi:hypothetical protein
MKIKIRSKYNKKQAVKFYRKVAKLLHHIGVPACHHISRSDNNKVFEMAFALDRIAENIEKEYNE